MEEIGIDISDQKSKTLERYLGESFDYVVTVCDEANEACPVTVFCRYFLVQARGISP
jgi:arsenate reductase (thioredoxin)